MSYLREDEKEIAKVCESQSGPFHILALDGGGARGIYSAQVLSGLEQTLGTPVGKCFDLIAGASTGSIIAGAAAIGVPMTEIVQLFEKEAPRVFQKKWPGSFHARSKYSRHRLEGVIRNCVSNLTLGEISIPLMIMGSNISTGEVHVFKSRYLKDLGEPYVRDGDVPLSNAILASCAAPTYFDPVSVGSSLLADGGLWANNPSIMALTEAVSMFGRSLEDVHVLSIGTGHSSNLYSQSRHWGLLTGWGREKLVSYFLDLQSQASTNMAKLILADRYLRLDPEIGAWDLDDTSHLDNLKALAERDFAHQNEAIVNRIRIPTSSTIEHE